MAIAFSPCLADAEETGNTPPSRHMTLQEAVQLALKHNHDIRIAGYTVDEKQQAKQVAKSSYFPSIRNDSSFMHVTDTQLIQINAGSLGVAGGTQIPPVNSIINQGGRSLTTSGTQITQPLTTLLKIKARERYGPSRGKSLAREGTAYRKRCSARRPSGLLQHPDRSGAPQRHRGANKGLRGPSERARRAGKVRQHPGTGVDRQPRAIACKPSKNC